MNARIRCHGLAILFLGAVLAQAVSAAEKEELVVVTDEVSQGALRVESQSGIVECPLKHTDVKARISGFIARVKVTQTFHNPFDEKIEAVYVFPLPHNAAVDDMTMVVGERRIVGIIKKRAEARRIYEQAVRRGATASLLEQERPNIFTQTVGNIPPGEEVDIEISYVDVLAYDMGTYEFHFPMVVGPRFIPGGTDAEGAPQVPDAARLNPPVLKPGYRTGHDISLSVDLEAGVPVRDKTVIAHRCEIAELGESKTKVVLLKSDSIPNKDFILRYSVVGEKPEMALLSHAPVEGEGGTFMLMIQPRIDEELKKAPPRDVCFLIDVSGSMRGHPMAQVRKTMKCFFDLSKPEDRVQVVTFAGSARQLFRSYVPATEENIQTALNFTRGMRGGGGTHMLKGIRKVLAEAPDQKRVRIVIMLTDGYIGNEAQIIDEVGRRCGDKIRFWALGIGNSINRYLIDGVAKQGGGMGKVLTLREDPSELVEEIVVRIHRAQLDGIRIDWGPLDVYERYPVEIPSLWAGRPVVLFARYRKGAEGEITISGDAEGRPLSYTLDVALPDREPKHDVLAKVWARRKIKDLSLAMAGGEIDELVDEITRVALKYRLMSRYTSFVAVDEKSLGEIEGPVDPPRRVAVPVPMPEGVSYRGVFGPEGGGRGGRLRQGGRFNGPAGGPPPAPSGAPVPTPPTPTPSPTPTPTPTPTPMPGASPRPASEPSSNGLARRAESKSKKEVARVSGTAFGGAWTLLRQNLGDVRKKAKAAFEAASAFMKEGDDPRALAHFRLAYMLDASCRRLEPWRRTRIGASSLEAISQLLEERRESWVEDHPFLEKKLDLVMENLDLEEAVKRLSGALGCGIEVEPGALEDVEELLHLESCRVVYLDLRGATGRQGLDWLLGPFHLDWSVDGEGSVRATSSRRLAGPSPWAYSVGALYEPFLEALAKNEKEGLKKTLEAQEALLEEVRGALEEKAGDGVSPLCLFFDPSTILVFAEPAGQAGAKAVLEGAEGREAFLEKLEALKGRMARAEGLSSWSWNLLSGAARGEVDGEALAHLREAWRGFELAEGETAGLSVYRSLFVLTESARALGGEAAEAARGIVEAQEAVLTGGGVKGLPALYQVLANRNASALGWVGEDAFAEAEALSAVSALEATSALSAKLLLGRMEAGELDPGALSPSRGRFRDGEDGVVLGALAARKAGGEVWASFRGIRSEALRAGGVGGGAAVLVHRLSEAALPVVE